MEQFRVVSLKCPGCGGALDIAPQIATFACGYCGASVLVSRSGGTISLSLEAAIARVQVGTDKTAAELAIDRLERELEDLESEKGVAKTGVGCAYVMALFPAFSGLMTIFYGFKIPDSALPYLLFGIAFLAVTAQLDITLPLSRVES